MSVNTATLLGRLTSDVKLNQSPGKTAVAKFGLATNKRLKDGEKATFHNIVCFGKTAENASMYLSKGRQVFIEGYIDNTTYEKDGTKFYRSEIIVNSLEFLGENKKQSETDSNNHQSSQPAYTAQDIPF